MSREEASAMKPLTIFLTIVLLTGSLSEDIRAQEKKLAQTGMKFLGVSTDARASAMGDAVTALSMASSAMFYNPASMAWTDRSIDLAFGTTQWIADIQYYHAAAS